MNRADFLLLFFLLCVLAYVFGRITAPGKPPREQFNIGLQFIMGQLSLVVIAGAIVLAIWMAL